MKTKSAYKKYDDILKNQENDVTIRKRFAHGEFDESIKILKKLQAERKLKSN